MIISEKLFSVKCVVLTVVLIMFLGFIINDEVIASNNNSGNERGASTQTGFVNNLYQLNMIIEPNNIGMVNIVPAKELFDQDEIVQLVALPNGINGQQNGNVYIEAETGAMNGNLGVESDESASSKFYIYGTTGSPKDGASKYSFTITESGNYYIWGRCYALSIIEDSFFMLMDGSADTLTWHLSVNYNTWEWQRVSHNRVVQQFNLDEGEHELIVIKRDLNARLDNLIITKDENFQPEGKEELPLGDVSYQFDYWGGDLSGTDNPMEITMDADKNGIAYFNIEGDEVVNVPLSPSGPLLPSIPF